jgi:hypothetical protein
MSPFYSGNFSDTAAELVGDALNQAIRNPRQAVQEEGARLLKMAPTSIRERLVSKHLTPRNNPKD